jgi:hypothetical protein
MKSLPTSIMAHQPPQYHHPAEHLRLHRHGLTDIISLRILNNMHNDLLDLVIILGLAKQLYN